MTLDHLRIMNLGMSRIIQSLAGGIVPQGAASTAAVKPSPLAGASVVPAYEQSCDTLLATAAAASDLHTSVRYTHPWFGPMNAAAWHTLAGVHMGLHREQLARIIRALPAATA